MLQISSIWKGVKVQCHQEISQHHLKAFPGAGQSDRQLKGQPDIILHIVIKVSSLSNATSRGSFPGTAWWRDAVAFN